MSVYLKKSFETYISDNCKTAISSISYVAEKHNKKIYLIGGAVRDIILKKDVKDIDITIETDAVEFSEILQSELNCEVISVQENLKTAKIKFPDGVEIDLASTREEQYDKAGNLPVAYNFGCPLGKDVKRRDFTINTLAISLSGKEKYDLIDYYNGYEDILNRKLRILHNKSFIDDPSRIIRALKFQVRFDLTYDENTWNLMQSYLNNADYTIPFERIKGELKQYFAINQKGLYKKFIETNACKLVTLNPVKNLNEMLLENIQKYLSLQEDSRWFIYLTFLCLNNVQDERLNLNGEEKKIIEEVIELIKLNPSINETDYGLYSIYNEKSELSLAIYYIMTENQTVIKYITTLRSIKLLITGNDLIELGFKPSPRFGEIFEEVLKAKFKGNIETKNDEIAFVQKYYADKKNK